jgi:hypothetical protein
MATVLEIVIERIKAALSAIQVGDPLAALFKNVYEEGDELDETNLPVAAIVFDPETVLETTEKTKLTMPFSVEVGFEIAEGETPRERGALILSEIKKALHTNRTLPGSNPASAAIDLRYAGGGNTLYPMNGENPCSYWGFVAEFEVDYRHRTADPSAVA